MSSASLLALGQKDDIINLITSSNTMMQSHLQHKHNRIYAHKGPGMNAKQWLAITFVVILNIIIFGALFSQRAAQPIEPTPSRTPYATFTPMPFPTATAILMPTFSPPPPTPTPLVHVVVLGETLETIATAYRITEDALRKANDLPESVELEPGDQLILPSSQQ
jgi:LysM repeat protein